MIKFIILCLVMIETPNIKPITAYLGEPIVAPPIHEFFKHMEQPVEEEEITIPVCSSSASKSYMDWSATSETSVQGRFIREKMTIRDGLLYDVDDYIGVALGSYFGPIGSRYIFVLDTGIELKLIKVEAKSDRHTINGCEHTSDHSVIEFVIDTETNVFPYFTNQYIANGNYNNLPQFNGSIVKIIKK